MDLRGSQGMITEALALMKSLLDHSTVRIAAHSFDLLPESDVLPFSRLLGHELVSLTVAARHHHANLCQNPHGENNHPRGGTQRHYRECEGEDSGKPLHRLGALHPHVLGTFSMIATFHPSSDSGQGRDPP